MSIDRLPQLHCKGNRAVSDMCLSVTGWLSEYKNQATSNDVS